MIGRPLTFEVFTLFPAAIDAFVSSGVMGRAIEREKIAVHCTNFRDFAADPRRTVDDQPFGGGGGMLIRAAPVVAALEEVSRARGAMHRILLTPAAPRFDQDAAERLAKLDRIGLICGRYEGIDDRVRENHVDECLSIGDFVLNGGEVAAAAVIEAVARLREGVLGNPCSLAAESFAGTGLARWLEHPHYTRPVSFRGAQVPQVLLAGDHRAIRHFRLWSACLRTWSLRPELRAGEPGPTRRPLLLALSGAGVEGIRKEQIEGWEACLTKIAPEALDRRVWLAGKDFADLASLRRLARRSFGEDPRLVGLRRVEGDPGVAGRFEVVLDFVNEFSGSRTSPIILVADLAVAVAAGASGPKLLDACDAHILVPVEALPALANEDRMADVSRPAGDPSLEWVERALAGLAQPLAKPRAKTSRDPTP